MKKDLIDTIMEKEFHELTETERLELREFCATESEYIQMKEVFLSVERLPLENPTPRTETKQKLDDLFASTYPKAAPIWYSSVGAFIVRKNQPIYRQPLMQIAAVGLLLLLIYPIWNVSEVENPETTEFVTNDVNQDKSRKKQKQNSTSEAENTVIDEKQNTKREVNDEKVLVASAMKEPVSSNDVPGRADSKHPDGVYVSYSQPASDAPEMLDLLTTAF